MQSGEFGLQVRLPQSVLFSAVNDLQAVSCAEWVIFENHCQLKPLTGEFVRVNALASFN